MSPAADHLLYGLDPEQIDAVACEAPVVRVVAGAGSGKTRVLTRRVAYRALTRTADPERSLVVTFTRAAASELSGRLARLGVAGVTTGTLHATAWALIGAWWAQQGRAVPTMADRDDLLRRLSLGTPRASRSGGSSTGDLPSALTAGQLGVEIGWAASRMLSPERYAAAAADAGRLPATAANAVAQAMDRLQTEKARRNLVDYDDVLALCLRAFDEDARFAEAQRWRFRHLFVDEFQDLTPLQFHLLAAWTGGEPDLFVVGDPHQAIYAWNGSDPSLMGRLNDAFPGTVTVRLARNYRCSPAIQAVASTIIDGDRDSPVATAPGLAAPIPEGPLRSVHRSGSDGDKAEAPIPSVHRFATEGEEAAGISRILRAAAARGVPWSKMAVLVRTNALADSLGLKLAKVDVPVVPTTFHRAKGLEFDTVIIASVEEGVVPLVHAGSPEAIAEERRLLYVATTRASTELHLTWAARRGRTTREPSRYLDRIEAECRKLSAVSPAAEPSGAREALRAARAALAGESGGADG